MSEFEWRNGMRKVGGSVEPERDLWPDIASKISAVAQEHRRSRMPAFAIAAGVLFACGAVLFAWQLQNTPVPLQPTLAANTPATKRVINNVVETDEHAPRKVLANANDELSDASASIQQALEQRPDAVFLVNLLNKTNSQRLRVMKKSYAG
jgi:apolipoprotein N-acyltransferase